MKLIEKIEIRHFRSFLGTPKKYSSEIIELVDLNVFSGANDSGKSNILRALNLFFNKEVSWGNSFDFERDFFYGKKESGHRVVEISISFVIPDDPRRDRFLPDRFTISKFYDRNGFRNCLYKFKLKEIGEVQVDDRSENNAALYKLFLQKNKKHTAEEIENAKKREWNYRVKFAGFLNKSVAYEYIPAIRDKNFFAQLFGRVIHTVKVNEEQNILDLIKEREQINDWSKVIKNKGIKKEQLENLKDKAWRDARVLEINMEIEKEKRLDSKIKFLELEVNSYVSGLLSALSFMTSEFRVGKDLREFFEGFDIETGGENKVSLSLRGDGLQAKYVPKMLDFLSQIDREKKYFIWGFEEPENSAEYKNQQELAAQFRDTYSVAKQVFLTTHSEEFLQLYSESEEESVRGASNLYHVKKEKSDDFGEYSKVHRFNSRTDGFDGLNISSLDIGESYIRAKFSKEIKKMEEEFLREKADIERVNLQLKSDLEIGRRPILYVEDTCDDVYKIAWLKRNGISCDAGNFHRQFEANSPFDIFRAEGAPQLAGAMRATNIDMFKKRKVVGLFDFDGEGVQQFNAIKNKTFWKSTTEGIKREGLYKKRLEHEGFYVMLLPVPERLFHLADIDFPSVIEVENLLSDSLLLEHGWAVKKRTTGNTEYLSIQAHKKTQMFKGLVSASIDDFKDFDPLFARLKEFFK